MPALTLVEPVYVLALLRMRVPPPESFSEVLPLLVSIELIVAVSVVPTVKLPVALVRTLVLPGLSRVKPLLLNVSELANWLAVRLIVPGVPLPNVRSSYGVVVGGGASMLQLVGLVQR